MTDSKRGGPTVLERGLFLTLSLFIVYSFTLLPGCDGIVNFMAFHPDKRDVVSAERLPSQVQELFINTADSIKLQSYFVEKKSSDKLLIYFHGNAGNLSHRLYDLIRISDCNINVLGISYRGYGKSQGTPDEKGVYTDGRSALHFAEKTLGFSHNNIVVMGRSIGTTVAVESARKLNIAGLILVSPLTTGKEQAKASGLGLVAFIAGDSFNNSDKMADIVCPVLVIHGTADTVIPVEMGETIFNRIKTKKRLVKIEGAGHNDLSTRFDGSYWKAVAAFLQQVEKRM